MLGKESDLASRRALWQANYEVAELTGKVGKPEDALAAHRQVLAAREALAAESPADPEIKADVGRSLTAVAGLLETTGKTKEAEATYRKAETLLVELAPTIAEAAAARAVLANCRSSLGGCSAARAATTKPCRSTAWRVRTRRRWPPPPGRRPSPGGTWQPRSTASPMLLAQTGKSSEAEAEYRKALAIQQKLADDNPAVTEFRSSLALSHNNLGILLASTGKSSEAEAEYRKALALQQKLADDNPAVTEFRSRLAISHNNLGYAAVQTGKLIGSGGRVPQGTDDPAEAGRRQPRRHRIPQPPGDQPQQPRLACCRIRASRRKRRPSTARRWRSEQKLADDNPAIPSFQRDLADSLLRIGWQLAQAGKTDEAIGYYTREEAIRQKLAEASSATPEDRDSLANCQTNMADVLRRSGRLDEALAACERALAVREPLVEAHPEVRDYRAGLGETYLRLGQVRCDMENLAGAAAAWKRALRELRREQVPRSERQTFFLACCHAGLAGLAGRPGSGVSAAEGADQAEKAMAVLRQAVTMGYRNPDAYRTESALDPLRNRPDFRVLMMDLRVPGRAVRPRQLSLSASALTGEFSCSRDAPAGQARGRCIFCG